MKISIQFILGILLVTTIACGSGGGSDDVHIEPEPEQSALIWDYQANGLPIFIDSHYLPLDRIHKISLFRSSLGHDYPDSFENCRSMKHYFHPLGGDSGFPHEPSWETIPIYSPISGEIHLIMDEWGDGSGGEQLWIASDQYPGILIVIFHVRFLQPLSVGDYISKDQQLGFHATDNTWSDIAIAMFTNEPQPDDDKSLRLFSIFDAMTDELFEDYKSYGATSRDDFIISKELRDANPMECVEYFSFTSLDPLYPEPDDSSGWFILQENP